MTNPVPNRLTSEQTIEVPQQHLVLDHSYVQSFRAGDTTPSVKGLEYFKANGVVTITDFDDGQEPQKIHILGDGNTTVDHNANIKRRGGAAGVLAADKVYIFFHIDGVWYENV